MRVGLEASPICLDRGAGHHRDAVRPQLRQAPVCTHQTICSRPVHPPPPFLPNPAAASRRGLGDLGARGTHTMHLASQPHSISRNTSSMMTGSRHVT